MVVIPQPEELRKDLIGSSSDSVMVHAVRLKHLDTPDHLGGLPCQLDIHVHVIYVAGRVQRNLVAAQPILVV